MNGAAGFRVEAQYQLARVLARRAGPGDPARARALAGEAVRQADALGMPPLEAQAQRLVGELDARTPGLTGREHEVAGLVAAGLTNRQIAERLYLSERTAQNHVQHILTKLDMTNRTQVAAWMSRRK